MAAGSRAGGPGLAQACRGGGRYGHPLAAAPGRPRARFGAGAEGVHGIAVTRRVSSDARIQPRRSIGGAMHVFSCSSCTGT